jgi:hypothetical protein
MVECYQRLFVSLALQPEPSDRPRNPPRYTKQLKVTHSSSGDSEERVHEQHSGDLGTKYRGKRYRSRSIEEFQRLPA